METSKNKKSRKMLALLLTIAMIMSMIPMNIAMAINDPYTYVNGTLTITDDSWFDLEDAKKNIYKNMTTDIVFGNEVTKIDAATFVDWTKLESVTIPDTVTTIDDTDTLQGLHLILIIWDENFFNWKYEDIFSNVKEVILTENVKIISEKAFDGWSKLEKLTMRGDVTTIGVSSFEGCTSLEDISIPDTVETIGDSAFKGCISLEDVYISKSVKTIGKRAFEGCTSLYYLRIGDNVETIGANAFEGCTSLEVLEIPSNVETIGESAFEGCSSAKYIFITDSIKTMGADAFSGFSALRLIGITNGDQNKVKELLKDGGVLNVESLNFLNGEFLTVNNYSWFDEEIDEEFISTITMVVMGEDIKIIPDEAFKGYDGLDVLIFSNDLEKIGISAFENCDKLETVVIPENVTTIGSNSFKSCAMIEDIVIPKSIKAIGEDAFNGCIALSTVYVDSGDTNRVKGLFTASGVTNVDELTFIEPDKNHRHKNIDLTDQEKAEDERNAKKLGSFGFDTASKGEHAIRTRWIASDNADGYIIYRSTEKDGNYERISKITDESILEYRDENLEANTHYYYKVASYVANTIGTKKVYSKKYLKAKRYTTK